MPPWSLISAKTGLTKDLSFTLKSDTVRKFSSSDDVLNVTFLIPAPTHLVAPKELSSTRITALKDSCSARFAMPSFPQKKAASLL